MLTDAEVASMRATAEAILTDACVISGPASFTFDPDEGSYTAEAGDGVYTGACRATIPRGVNVAQAGDAPITFGRYDILIPTSVTDVTLNHVVVLSASRDAALVGKPLRILDVQAHTDSVLRRLACELELDPAEAA